MEKLASACSCSNTVQCWHRNRHVCTTSKQGDAAASKSKKSEAILSIPNTTSISIPKQLRQLPCHTLWQLSRLMSCRLAIVQIRTGNQISAHSFMRRVQFKLRTEAHVSISKTISSSEVRLRSSSKKAASHADRSKASACCRTSRMRSTGTSTCASCTQLPNANCKLTSHSAARCSEARFGVVTAEEVRELKADVRIVERSAGLCWTSIMTTSGCASMRVDLQEVPYQLCLPPSKNKCMVAMQNTQRDLFRQSKTPRITPGGNAWQRH